MTDKKSRLKKSNSRSEMSTSSSNSTSSFSSDDDCNEEDFKPIKDYLKNRREVARQLFKSVKVEKIRMMLPQALKKMSLTELEECCANELCGMSKTRILSILNAAPMLNSSDTSDSNDSGPSLEIISDTEEWLTDDDTQIKRELLSPSSKLKKIKNKGKSKLQAKNSSEKLKTRKTKAHNSKQTDTVKIKNEKVETKNREGESLLDLLELEMRARAIRALIRKEEDIIPTPGSEQKMLSNINALQSTLDSVASTKNKTNSAQQLKETIEVISDKIGEDEDVVLVVKPTPTIELISSDSESESLCRPMSKKIGIEKTPEKRVVSIDKSGSGPDALKIVVTQKVSGTSCENSGDKSKVSKSKKDKESKSVELSDKESDESVSGLKQSDNTDRPIIKKVKKKHHLRKKQSSVTSGKLSENELEKQGNSSRLTDEQIGETIVDKSHVKREKKSPDKKNTSLEDDRLDNYEGIIDLDDYPDDMYNIEPEDCDITEGETVENKIVDTNQKNPKDDSPESAETWATRYYQTDSVQNVIKESKIQSEIRKRLRERQRLSKLNNSPKLVQGASEEVAEASKPKPTGSVEEYFALKSGSAGNITSTTAGISATDDITNHGNEKSPLVSKDEESALAVPNTPEFPTLPTDPTESVADNSKTATETPAS